MSAPPKDVQAAFAAMPDADRSLLLEVRDLVFEAADDTGAGPLTETLKWGQPAYLTEATKAGTTVRLGVEAGQAAVFFHCQTNLVDGFRSDFPEAFDYSGNRAIRLRHGFDRAALALCLARALTYHRDKRKRRA